MTDSSLVLPLQVTVKEMKTIFDMYRSIEASEPVLQEFFKLQFNYTVGTAPEDAVIIYYHNDHICFGGSQLHVTEPKTRRRIFFWIGWAIQSSTVANAGCQDPNLRYEDPAFQFSVPKSAPVVCVTFRELKAFALQYAKNDLETETHAGTGIMKGTHLQFHHTFGSEIMRELPNKRELVTKSSASVIKRSKVQQEIEPTSSSSASSNLYHSMTQFGSNFVNSVWK
jgi:hypothetical protein